MVAQLLKYICRILWYRILHYSVCNRPPLGQIKPLHSTPHSHSSEYPHRYLAGSEGKNWSGSRPAYIRNGVEWTASRSDRFIPWKEPAVPIQQEAVLAAKAM
jgi:hypothetical protein